MLLYLLGQSSGQQSNPLVGLLPLILIFVVFYFLLILPQQRRQKQHQRLLSKLEKGDRVITSSGIYGTIVNVKDHSVILLIADGVKVEMEKSHIIDKLKNVKEQNRRT
ncbi:preprotein translocase subunit YajC [candidate division WOR-3 bacterium 4484_100]|uniref:Preprotein translocase subunit YajC n=1 Tax=candidate division WOR-3 bacterium 4484_100 TaxID=1936077 RepID=A0A1V4QGH6_UNCW3|nr:MAG: preprotein translocase subunit YajC [candidate division WOR-3 bacterium 4484_100]